MAENLRLVVEANGDVAAVYDDALVPTLSALGPSVVERASHVEPSPHGGWTADMGPVGGPVLGWSIPYATRAAALAAERDWLRAHLGL